MAAHAVVGFRVIPPSDVRWGRGASQRATRALARGHRAAWLHLGISRGARSRRDSGHRGICGAHSPRGRRTPASGRFAPQPAPRPRDTGDRGSYGAKLGGDAGTGAARGFQVQVDGIARGQSRSKKHRPTAPGTPIPVSGRIGIRGFSVSGFHDATSRHVALRVMLQVVA